MTSTKPNGRQPDLRESGSSDTAGNAGATFATLAAVFIDAARRDKHGRVIDVDCAGSVWGANMPEGDEEAAGNGRE